MKSPIVCLLFAAFLMAPARADVIDVRGPAPDHAQIADAVTAALDGDVIRVWPGSYAPFTLNDRSLTIVRATQEGQVLVVGSIQIHALAAERDVELTGISAYGVSAEGLLIQDCQGSVRIREGVYKGHPQSDSWPASNSAGVRIERCADVELVYCTSTGGLAGQFEYGGPGAAGLRAIDSHVSLFASSFTGSNGTADDDPGASGYMGGDGVHATGIGALFAAGCSLRGGYGGSADYDPDWWTGEYGWGGDGGWAHSGNTPAWLRDCSLLPGAGGWSPDPSKHGSPGQPSSGANLLPGAARLVRTSWLVDDLNPLLVRCQGEVGENVWLIESPRAAYRLADPAFGPLLVWISPAPLASPWRWIGRIGPDGLLLTSLPARDLPHLTHRTPHFQAVFTGPSGNVLSSSSWSVILDAAW